MSYLNYEVTTQVSLSYYDRTETPRPKGWGFFMSKMLEVRGPSQLLFRICHTTQEDEVRGTSSISCFAWLSYTKKMKLQWDLSTIRELVSHVRYKLVQRDHGEFSESFGLLSYMRNYLLVEMILSKNKFKRFTRNVIVYWNLFRTFV